MRQQGTGPYGLDWLSQLRWITRLKKSSRFERFTVLRCGIGKPQAGMISAYALKVKMEQKGTICGQFRIQLEVYTKYGVDATNTVCSTGPNESGSSSNVLLLLMIKTTICPAHMSLSMQSGYALVRPAAHLQGDVRVGAEQQHPRGAALHKVEGELPQAALHQARQPGAAVCRPLRRAAQLARHRLRHRRHPGAQPRCGLRKRGAV